MIIILYYNLGMCRLYEDTDMVGGYTIQELICII